MSIRPKHKLYSNSGNEVTFVIVYPIGLGGIKVFRLSLKQLVQTQNLTSAFNIDVNGGSEVLCTYFNPTL